MADRTEAIASAGAETIRVETVGETRVERLPSTVRVTHVFEHRPTGARLLTEPFTAYG